MSVRERLCLVVVVVVVVAAVAIVAIIDVVPVIVVVVNEIDFFLLILMRQLVSKTIIQQQTQIKLCIESRSN